MNCIICGKIEPLPISVFVAFQDKPEMYCTVECLKQKEFI